MAERIWTGAVSTDVTVAGNYLGGAAPGPGDDVLADRGSVAMTGTMVALTNFRATPGWRGNMGTSGSPLTFGAVTLFSYAASGQFANITSSGTITAAVLDMLNAAGMKIVGGTWTLVTSTLGKIIAEAAAVLTTLRINGSWWEIGTNATAITALTGWGKVDVDSRNLTDIRLHGPSSLLITRGTATGTTPSTGAVAAGMFTSGARYNKKSAATDSTVDLIGPGTVMDVAGNPNAASALTTLNRWSDAKVYERSGGHVMTIGTENAIGADTVPAAA